MAKRKNSSIFNAVAKAEMPSSISAVTEISNITTDNKKTIEAQETISYDADEIEQLRQQLKQLTIENDQLTEALASRIEDQTTTSLSSLSSDIASLQSQNTALRNENDSYLMKISELTFENAKLTAQLQQLQSLSKDTEMPAKTLAPVKCNNTSSQKSQQSKSNFVLYNSNNGYTDWN